jgi:hypothetical protein
MMNKDELILDDNMANKVMAYEKPLVDALDMATQVMGSGGSQQDGGSFDQIG